jgi:hypothetical protein
MMTRPCDQGSAQKGDGDHQWNRHGMKIPVIVVSGEIAPTADSRAK